MSIYRPEGKEGEDTEPVVYATCTDKSIREIKTITDKKDSSSNPKAKETGQYTEGTTYNQVITSF